MLRLTFFCLILFLTAPARADVTAHYRSGSAGEMIVRLGDNGETLIEHGPDAKYLTIGGETYLLLADARGPFTTRRETFLAALRALTGDLPPPSLPQRFSIVENGEETVGGFAGRRLSVGTENSRQDRMDIVISAAPELAALGRAVAGHLEPWFGAVPGTPPELLRTMRMVLEQGALLRLGPLFTLERVDRSSIPAATFRLPSPPLDQAALTARLQQSVGH